MVAHPVLVITIAWAVYSIVFFLGLYLHLQRQRRKDKEEYRVWKARLDAEDERWKASLYPHQDRP